MPINLLLQPKAPAERLSDYLRHGDDHTLAQRRAVVALSLISVGALGVIGLYQTGVIRNVPDLPGKWFDGNRINGSTQAYRLLSTPDALLGLTSYGVTASLAAMGGRDRGKVHPWIPLALAAKATVDAAAAARLSYDQPTRYRAFCGLSILTSLCTFAALPLAWSQAKNAFAEIYRRWIEK